MTQEQAVIEVLRKIGKPSTLEEIYLETLKHANNLFNTKTPDASIRRIVQLSVHTKQYDRGIWGLTEYPIENDILSIDNKNNDIFYRVTSDKINYKELIVYEKNDIISFELIDCKEFTYFANSDNKLIKIGKTKNTPSERLNNLKTSNPSIYFEHVCPKNTYSEKMLHSKFSLYHYDLEWFHFSKDMKDFLKKEKEITNQLVKIYLEYKRYKDMEKDIISSIKKIF